MTFCNTHGPDDVPCAPCQYADGTSSVDLIAEVLTRNMALAGDYGVALAVCADLGWPKPEQYDCDLWVVDGESPHSLAEKIVAALAASDTPTPHATEPPPMI